MLNRQSVWTICIFSQLFLSIVSATSIKFQSDSSINFKNNRNQNKNDIVKDSVNNNHNINNNNKDKKNFRKEDLNNCLEWVLGYSKESCALTCSRVSRECSSTYLDDIINQENFYTMVASAMDLNSASAITSAEDLCTDGINTYTFANSPAVFTYKLCTAENEYVDQIFCNFPTSLSQLHQEQNGGDGCDVQYNYPPAQRFCPCVDTTNCFIPTTTPTPQPTVDCQKWVLGYSTESCTLTCGRLSGDCNPNKFADIVTRGVLRDGFDRL